MVNGRQSDGQGTPAARHSNLKPRTIYLLLERYAFFHSPSQVGEYTRECLAIDVDGGIRSRRVIEVLAQLVTTLGAPAYLRSDNGPEFLSRAIMKWLQAAGIVTALNDPGKPWQKGPRRIVQRQVPG